MKTYTKYLIIAAALTPLSNAEVKWGNCEGAAKAKVERALKDASRMASVVVERWTNSEVTSNMKRYFKDVTAEQKVNIRRVFGKIMSLNEWDLSMHCVTDYNNNIPDPITGQRCSNRETAFVPLQATYPMATNTIVFCPPIFSDVINSFLPENSQEICATRKGIFSFTKEQPLADYEPGTSNSGILYNTNYIKMIEWTAHKYPGKWALHELTHTLSIAEIVESTKVTDLGVEYKKKATTDVRGKDGLVAYGKTKVEALQGDNAYWNADNYAWMGWAVYRDQCFASGKQPVGEECPLRRRQVIGKDGKRKRVVTQSCKQPTKQKTTTPVTDPTKKKTLDTTTPVTDPTKKKTTPVTNPTKKKTLDTTTPVKAPPPAKKVTLPVTQKKTGVNKPGQKV